MKRIVTSLTLIAFVLFSYGQNSCVVKRGYAFYIVNMPGMIMKDDNGRDVQPTPNIERFIYIECSGSKMPVIESILYNNSPMTTTITRVEGAEISAGKKTGGGGEYKLSAKKGNTLWKADLANDKIQIKPDCKNIIIKTKAGGKFCKTYIYKETELEGIPRY
jgi:hypothetical protein